MNLLFIDESTSPKIPGVGDRLVSVTGVLVPASRYDAARTLFYQLVSKNEDWSGRVIESRDGRRFRVADGLSVRTPPPELHGVDLLRDRSDDEKIAVLGNVVRIVRDHDLRVFRVCLRLRPAVWKMLSTEGTRYLECWSYLNDLLVPVLERESVVPVWDAGNAEVAARIPALIRLKDFFRSVHGSKMDDASANLFGEMFFADSRYTVFVQIADLLSMILMNRDKVAAGWAQSEWMRRVLAVSLELPGETIEEIRAYLEITGTVHSLTSF